MVEDMLAYKGVIVTHKTIRQWAEKFGRDYANKIRRRTPRLGDKWHLDEAVVSIGAENTGCGAPLIRTASSSMSSCKAAGMPRQPSV